jgi:hypothetical protein
MGGFTHCKGVVSYRRRYSGGKFMPSYIRTRSEFAVNSFTRDNQTAPSVSTFADGGFIVVWGTSDPTQDGDDSAIKAQMFDSAGRKVGTEFLVNSAANGAQFTAEVETLNNGNFVVTWVTNISDDGTNGIKAQLFSRTGEPIGAEFKVNPNVAGSIFTANVTALANGGFVISWDDWNGFDMKAQLFDASGARVGGPFMLNTSTSGYQEYGDIVGLAGGGFVATWRTNDGSDGSGDAVKAQVFSASGAKVGTEFLVNSQKVGNQYSPALAALAGGGFVITWHTGDSAQDGSGGAIKAQIFSATGAKVGGEFLVNTQATDWQTDPVVTATPDGGFVIAWGSRDTAQDGSGSAIKAQAFNSTGAKVGTEMLVNTLATGAQFLPDLATMADGRVIVTWASESGDSGGYAVRAQILGTELAAPLPNTNPIVISNGGGTSASLTHDEMTTAVTTVVASDDGEPNNLRYSITGGADAALFTINALTGALAFRQAPDHEAPLDQGQDNFYNVTVTASDGQLTGSQSIEIYVRHLNRVIIESDGGWDYASLSISENETAVTTVFAVDDDGLPLTYSITGGDDAAAFTIDAQTGELSLITAPDFEMPADMYGDNVYYVTVTATDGTVSDTQDIAVYIEDVEEPDGFGIISDGAGDYGTVEADENNTAVTVVRTQAAAGEVLYEIVGGHDAYLFTIDSATGELTFIDAPDFENTSSGGWYSHYDYYGGYQVVVRASDGTSADEQELRVVVQDLDEAPVFYSYGGEPHVWEWAFENSRPVTYVWAQDPDRFSTVTYGIAGGADAALFEVDPESGELRFKSDPDYEARADADGDNVYEVTVAAYSGALSASQSFSIALGDQYERVTITSDGGQSDAEVTVSENNMSVTVVTARGDDYVYYEIAGGADADAFVIDPFTGALEFVFNPNFEFAKDLNRDNVYQVTVRASNGDTMDHQHLAITVQNVYEPPIFYDYWTYGAYSLWALENRSYISTVTAFDPEDGAAFTYSITGGADSAFFEVDPQSGAVFWRAGVSADYEAPADADGDNRYEVEITAAQGSWSRAQAFTVVVNDDNEAPAFVSGGGGDSAAVTIDENSGDVLGLLAVDPEGATPQYGITGGADAALFELDPVTKALRFKSLPDFEAPGDANGDNVYEVTVGATDGSKFGYQSVSVTVANVYEGVSFDSPARTFAVDEVAYALGAVSARGDAGAAIVYSIAGGADASSFTIDPATGQLAWVSAPDYEWPQDQGGDNVYDIVVSASDGTSTASQSVTVSVAEVDEPVEIVSYGGAASVSLTVTEEYYIVGKVEAEDDGFGTFDPIVFTITGGADAALFTVDRYSGALNFHYDLSPDFENPTDADGDNVYDVVVTASTSTSSDTQTFAINVANRNEGIFIASNGGGTSAFVSLDEGESKVTTVVADDPDGTAATYSIVGGPDAALFAIDPVTGVLTFIDAPDYEAPHNGSATNFYTVEVAASDGEYTTWQKIQIGIDNVNEGVTITSGGGGESLAVTVGENGTAVTRVVAGDVDGDALLYSISGGADSARFTINAQTGALSFVQAPDFEAPADAGGDNVYDVVVSVTDGEFTDSQAVAVTVANVGESVVVTSNGGGAAGAVAVAENGTAVTVVAAGDPDGGAVTYAIAGGADAARFTIDPVTGALAFVSAPNFEAPADAGGNNVYDVIVSASDGSSTDTQALAVSVGNVNEAVVIASNGGGASATVAAAENGTAVAVVAAGDPDGGPVTYAIAGGADASRFTIDATTGALAFVAAPDFEAPGDADGNNVYDVVVAASDGTFTDTQAIAVQVGNVNEAPAIGSNGGGASAAISVAENGLAVTTVTAGDPDGTAATYAIVGGADATRFTINPQTGLLQFVAAPDHELPGDSNGDNVYDVIVQASDGVNNDTQSLSVAVTNLRDGNNVTGTNSGDSISGTSSNAALRTSNSEDTVFGRDGHDTISGLGGDDWLHGDAGNDLLTGGAGADRLTGGLGKDQFVFNSASESAGAAHDVITDFNRGQGDKINLSGIDANANLIGNQTFTFIGTAAFSNVAGQLRFEQVGGNTFVHGDTDGNGAADFTVQLNGLVPLGGSDFLL